MQLTGNTGVERIELQGTLPDGAILQEAYKFFVEYRGDVMDDELTYELIKQLWVNGMIDNIGLLLPAFAKKQLSDSGGRQVVDKMFDVSLNRRIVEWSGTDRPEFTDFGGSKVCVEAERTNLFLNSDSLSTQAVTVSAEAYTVSMEGTGTITFSGDHTGTLEGMEGERVSTTFTPSAGSVTCTVSGTVTNAQFEAGPYPTNYIPTSGSPVTRLAPTVTIEDALPLTGTVAGVVDMVRPASGVMPLWTTGGNINTERSRFYITSGRELSCFVYGLNGGLVFTSFPLGSAGERFQMDWAMSWNESNLYLFIRSGEDQYLYSSSNVINNTGQRSIYLGADQNGENQFSTRFLVPWHKDTIVRTTEEEFEQLFETIS